MSCLTISGLPSDKGYSFTILHPSGKRVQEGQTHNGDQIHISQLPSGLYILNLNGEAIKFMKE